MIFLFPKVGYVNSLEDVPFWNEGLEASPQSLHWLRRSISNLQIEPLSFAQRLAWAGGRKSHQNGGGL